MAKRNQKQSDIEHEPQVWKDGSLSVEMKCGLRDRLNIMVKPSKGRMVASISCNPKDARYLQHVTCVYADTLLEKLQLLMEEAEEKAKEME